MKHYLSLIYGIDETLPDEDFYRQVREINKECEECSKKYTRLKGGENNALRTTF